jgi:hypothetical protein
VLSGTVREVLEPVIRALGVTFGRVEFIVQGSAIVRIDKHPQIGP